MFKFCAGFACFGVGLLCSTIAITIICEIIS
jgi:hypothetical protein